MSNSSSSAPLDAERLAAQIARFIGHDPIRLQSLANRSPRVAQLAFSFPLLFAILGSTFAPVKDRQQAFVMALDGAPLARIAHTLAIPFCLRVLQPEACGNGMHAAWSPQASRRIAPFVPAGEIHAADWLKAITFAHNYGDEAIATWFARRPRIFINLRMPPRVLLPIIVFAWHARHCPEHVPAKSTWSQGMELRSATRRSIAWLKTLKTHMDLGDGITDDWLTEHTSGPFTLHSLTTPSALLKESKIMDNCVIDYGEPIARNILRLYSVRKNGDRIATLEVRPAAVTRRPLVTELLGVCNNALPLDIIATIHTLVESSTTAITSRRIEKIDGVSQRFHGLLEHYIAAHQPHVPNQVEGLTFDELRSSLRFLAEEAGVEFRWPSW